MLCVLGQGSMRQAAKHNYVFSVHRIIQGFIKGSVNTVQYRECELKIIQSCGTFNTCPPNSSENTGEGLTGKS